MSGEADARSEAVARIRVATLLERLARIDLQVVVVSPPDGTRIAARDRARTAAIVAGRAGLLGEATDTAREVTLKAFARSGFGGTWAATDMAVSVATARDRAAAAAAFEEAATAAVVEDLVDDETLGVLRSTSGELADLTGLPSPGAISAFLSPASGRRGGLRAVLLIVFVLYLAFLTLPPGMPVWVGLVALALALAGARFLSRRPSRQ